MNDLVDALLLFLVALTMCFGTEISLGRCLLVMILAAVYGCFNFWQGLVA